MDFLSRLLDTSDFPARWHCGNWTTAHGWLHVLSDLGVWSAYFTIPGILAYFVFRKRDLPFRWLFLLFTSFILACGLTHLMDAAIFWWPAYRLSGLLKLTTALVSWTTVAFLAPAIPKILAMRSPDELEREIARRRVAELDLQHANEDLERRVGERTAELQEANARLADADRRKNEFLATLAHELRSPLAPLATGIELLKQGAPGTDAAKDVQAMMARQMRQLVTIVDDLLEVSRVTRGKIQLRRSRVDLRSVVEVAVEASRPFMEAATHRFDVVVPGEPLVLDADPSRLAQVVSNLLNNAAKYTPRGGRVELRVERQGGEAVLAVTDTGIGIPPDMLDRVFDMFMQVETPGEGALAGLGIGLTLVKSLVEMHGGRVSVQSDGEGKGTRVELRFPLAPAAADGTERETAPRSGRNERIPSRRVLVADDNADAATSLALVLRLQGHDVRTARDGREALAIAEEFHPDVVFMDLGMPVLNGVETGREMRRRAWGRGVVIVALTGWGQEEDRRRTSEAGFDRHLVKPADADEVARILAAASPR